MKDLTKVFIDLSKLSEEQVKEIRLLIFGSGEQSTHLVSGYTDDIVRTKLHYHESKIWTVAASDCNLEKTELTYPEFVRLFEGGEGEKKCCDNPDIQWNKVEVYIGDKQGSYKDLNYNFCDNCGATFNEAFD